MAAPSIRGVTLPTNVQNPSSPSSTEIDDLVVVFHWAVGASGALGLTLQGGFTQWANHFHNDGSTDGQLGIAWKIATVAGAQTYQAFAETGTVTARLAGILVLQAGTFDVTTPIANASNTTTSTGNGAPNPPALSGLTSGDYLVAALGAWHSGALAWAITEPANYTERLEATGTTTGELAVCTRALTGITAEDPAAFSDNQVPNGTVAATLAFAAGGILHSRTPADVLDLSDAATQAQVHGRSVADVDDLADGMTQVSGTVHQRSPADVESLADAETHVQAHARAPSDVEGLTDSTIQILNAVRSPADIETLADSMTRALALSRAATDTEELGDATSHVLAFARTPADVEVLSDASQMILNAVRLVGDELQLADSATSTVAAVRLVGDVLTLADSMTYLGGSGTLHTRAIADVLGLSDGLVATIIADFHADLSFGRPLLKWTFGRPELRWVLGHAGLKWTAGPGEAD